MAHSLLLRASSNTCSTSFLAKLLFEKHNFLHYSVYQISKIIKGMWIVVMDRVVPKNTSDFEQHSSLFVRLCLWLLLYSYYLQFLIYFIICNSDEKKVRSSESCIHTRTLKRINPGCKSNSRPVHTEYSSGQLHIFCVIFFPNTYLISNSRLKPKYVFLILICF